MSHVWRSSMFRFVVLVVACATLSVAAFAQSTVTGSIAGTVADPSKAVVVGAKVAIRNIETNVQTSVTTDAQGKFRVLQLQPGTYTVTAEAANFAPAKAQAVIVELGRITELELTLSVAGKTEAVEVTAEAPMVNTLQQDFTNNLNQEAISNLPINGRRWSTFALLTPGATPDGGYGLISFRGISGLLNNNTVDGGDNNQAFFSEERGRTRASYTVSQNSVREFQVNVSNYSAEYGRAAGGVVNSVTKSGTNKIHGEGFYYIRDNTLGAINPFSKAYVQQADGSWSNLPYKPEDRRQQFGGNVGGPIIKDKLFFFFNYDGQRRNFPGDAVPGSPALFGPMTTTGSGTANEQASIISRFNLSGDPDGGVARAQAIFSKAIGFMGQDSGIVPRRGDQDIFFPKLDWRVTQNNTVTMSYNRMRWNSPAGIQTQATNNYGVASFGDDYVKTDMLNARLTSTISNSMTNELRFQWGRDFEFQNSQPPSAIEKSTTSVTGASLITTPDGRLPGFNVAGTSNGMTFGRPNFLERAAYPNETRQQFADTVNLVKGKHLLKFGVDFDRTNDRYSNLYEGGGYYTYGSRLDFITDFTNFLNGTNPQGTGWYSNFYQGFGPLGIEFHTWDYSAFVQDDYRLLPRLTLSFGMRYEYEKMPQSMFPNMNVPQTLSLGGGDHNNLGPRVGFALDVFGDGKTSLRGGYGIYYGRINNGAIAGALFQTGAKGTQSVSSFKYSAGPAFPNVCSQDPNTGAINCGGTGSTTAGTSNIIFMDPHVQNPQIHQADLILEREVSKNTVVSVNYLMSLGRELPIFLDTNIAPSSQTISYIVNGGPYNGQTFSVPYYGTRLNSKFGSLIDLKSAVNSTYNALVAKFERRMTNGLQFSTSYTWAHAIDNGQNSQTQTSSYGQVFDPYDLSMEHGTSNFDMRHRVTGSLVYQPQYFRNSGRLTKALADGWSLAPLVIVSTGVPYTESTSGNGYICPVAATSGACTTTSGSNAAIKGSSMYGLGGGLNGSGGTFRLAPLAGRNNWSFPNFANIDLRLSRIFKVTERQKVEFIAEAFNLFNSEQITNLNKSMYVTQAPSSTTPLAVGAPTVLNYVNNVPGYSAFGSFTQAGTNLYRERQVQFAVRYSF